MINPVNFSRYYKDLLPELTKSFQEFILAGRYIGGKLVEDFEYQIKSYLGAKYVIGCKSGTHALQLALIASGIGDGDEVVTVANTYYATVYAITSVGATPVFCDVFLENGQMDHNEIEKKITKKTKAIMPVHLYGIPVDLKIIKQICKKHKLTLIEDCSHAFGTKYDGKYIGSDSEFGCFSLYPTKNIGAFGDAGIIVVKNKKYEKIIRDLIYLSNPEGTKFNPDALHAMLDPIQASLISVVFRQMQRIELDRKKRADIYRRRLGKYVRMCQIDKRSDVVFHQFPIFVENRKKLISFLRKSGVLVQTHYSINLHHLPHFGGHPKGSLPTTERHNNEQVSLSVHPSVSIKEVDAVCDLIKEYVQKNGK